MSIFEGSGVALITPFNSEGVDYNELKNLLEYHVKEGTDAIIICGTTGEAATMTESEKKQVIKFTIQTINKRIPVIAGTGSNNTMQSIEMSKYAESVGVDGLLVINPFYNKTSQEGIYKHFEAINNSVKTPIIVYNVPSRTNVNISPNLLKRISNLNNIVAVKEASGDLSQIIKIKKLCPDIDIYSGCDDQIVSIMSVGGKGVISVLANILPKEVHNMVYLYKQGKTSEALKIQLDTLDIANNLFIEPNPIPIKAAMKALKMDSGMLRLPLVEMKEDNNKLLIDSLTKYNLI